MVDKAKGPIQTGGTSGFTPLPFGRVPTQRIGALLFYIAALFPISGWIIQEMAGPSNFYVYNSANLILFVILVVPVLLSTILTGVVLSTIGSVVWFVKHRSHAAPSDVVATVRSVPPVLLAVLTAIFASMLASGTFTLDTDTFTGSLWWSVDVYFTIYVAIAAAGVILEIYSGLRNRRKTPS